MSVGLEKITAHEARPTLTPAIREFLDGLAEIIARDILTLQAGDAETREEPGRTLLRGASSC